MVFHEPAKLLDTQGFCGGHYAMHDCPRAYALEVAKQIDYLGLLFFVFSLSKVRCQDWKEMS